MDFHGMKRKRLQTLCKKHGIPANLKNKEMADRLSLIFKEKEIEDHVGSLNGGTKKDTLRCVGGKDMLNVEMIDLVSPSPGLEERTDFSAKILKSSEVERLEFETNLSPEITREEFGICGVEEDMKSGLNKEQAGDSQEGLQLASDVVALEEFDNHLVEGEVEKLGDQTNLPEDVCGKTYETEKQDNADNPEGSETEMQEENGNNPEGSNRNDLNLLLVSPDEFGYPLVEGEVHKSDDCVRVHDAVHNVGNGRSEVDTMCLDTSTGAMDIDGKTNVTVEHFIDEVHSSSEVNSSNLNTHKMDVLGTTRNSDTCEARFVSSPMMSLSPASDRMIGFSPKLLNLSETKVLQSETNFSPETLKVDIEICDVEENIQIDVNKEQLGDSEEVEHAAPNVMAMNNENLVQVPSEEFGNHLLEGEVEKLGDKNNFLEHVCENGKARDEAVEQGDHSSPQGSNMKDVNVLHVSQEESGYPLVEEVKTSDIYNGGVYNLGNSGFEVDAKDTDGKTNLSAEHFADDVPSSSLNKYSDGTPDQFQRTYPENEVKSSGLNIHQDICEEKLKSPQTTCPIADPGECFVFSPDNLEGSAIKGFQAETYFYPSTIGDVGGTCSMKESMQSDKMEKVQCSQEVLHTTNNVNLLPRSMEECNIHIVQGEATELFDNSDVHNDAGGNGGEDDTNTLQGSNRNVDNVDEMFVLGTATSNADTCEARFVSSPMMSLSPASERMIGFSPKLLNLSETKVLQSETNFSPETLKVDIEICNMKENIHIDVNMKQVGYGQEVVLAASNVMVMSDEDLVQVTSEGFGNHLLEGEFEKLADKVNLLEDVCENGKGRDEAVERGSHNNSQGSNTKDVNVNVLHVSQEESGYPLVEEVKKSDDNNGGVYYFGKSGSEVDAKDTDGKTNLTPEHFADDVPNVPSNFKYSDGTPDQFLRTYPVNEVKSSGLNIHQDIYEELKSPQKAGPIAVPGECIGFSPNNLEASVIKGFNAETYFESSTCGDVAGTCNVEESMESDKMETVEYSQEVLHTTNNMNLLHKSMEECNINIEHGDDTGLFDNSDVHDDAGGNGEDDTNTPQGSNRKDLNLLQVSHKEFGNPLVEGVHKLDDCICVHDAAVYNVRSEVDSRCLESSIGAINNDEKTNVTVEQFMDEVHSSTFFPEAKVLQSEIIFFPEAPRVDIGVCDMDENMQIDVNKVQVDDNQRVIHAASCVMVLNNEDLVQVASVEVGDNLLEGEVEKSGLIADSEECIGFFPNNLEPSATKGFNAGTYFDPSTLGDVVATCNMEESMQSDQMEKEYSQEVLCMANELVLLQRSMEESNPVEEVTRLFDNSVDHEDAGGTGAEEDKSQHYIRRDIDSNEKYLLNEFQSIDDASGQNSDKKPGKYAPTMLQPGEMKPCTFNHQQISASGTVSGDEGTFQEKLESPSKCTPIANSKDTIIFYPKLIESSMKKELKIVKSLPVKHARDALGTSDMKENIKIAKKEHVASIVSKSAFPKRQPLRDLQQN